MARRNLIVTVGASPINAFTGLTGTQMATFGPLRPVLCRSVFVQMLPGGTGYGVVSDGIYGAAADGVSPRVPTQTLAAANVDVTAVLGPATATAPGGNYGDPNVQPNGVTDIDITRLWVGGSNAGDLIVISYTTTDGKGYS